MKFISLDSLSQLGDGEVSIPQHILDYVHKKIDEDAKIEEKKIGNKLVGYNIQNANEEYWLYLDFEDAKKDAIEEVENRLKEEPESFTQSWLSKFLYIGDTDMRTIIVDEIENRRSDRMYELDRGDYSSLQDLMEKHKNKKKKYKTEKAYAKAMLEIELEEYEKELEKSLKNPIKYFVEEQGLYSVGELMKLDFIKIDVEKAAKDAVKTDGVGHFLSTYDGEITTIKGIGYLVRLN